MKSARRHCKVIVAVGSQKDLVSQRMISEKEARAYFKDMNPPIRYFEVSAKTGEGVEEVFQFAMREWIRLQDGNGKSKDTKDKCIIC